MPDFDDRVDGTDSPNRTPVPRGWTSVGTDTPQHVISVVYALHYGRDADYTFVGLFASEPAAKARVNADLWKYANLGFENWPVADGMPPEYPEIEKQVVHGAPPVMRGDDLQPRSYEKRRPLGDTLLRGIVSRDRATGRLVGRDDDGKYYWDDTATLLTQDECDELGLDSRDA